MPRLIRVLTTILAMSFLAGCSIQPLYMNENVTNLELRYADPETRLEQVAYQTISQRIARSASGDAPTLTLSVSLRGASIGRSNVPSPLSESQSVARVTATVRDSDGNVLFRETREASSTYQRMGQYVANDTARAAAAEQATRTASDSIRLLLLAWASNQGAS